MISNNGQFINLKMSNVEDLSESSRQPWMRRFLRKITATYRLNSTIICEESRGKGLIDYHDYPDDIEGIPVHFFELTCKRCGKRFTI